MFDFADCCTVVDFALCGGRFATSRETQARQDPERLWVIELNPWMPSTDGALYSWKHDGDLLHNGLPNGAIGTPATTGNCSHPSNGLDFRVRDKYEPSVRAQLEHRWRKLLVDSATE